MKLSVIWKLSGEKTENQTTWNCLIKESDAMRQDMQLLIYGEEENCKLWEETAKAVLPEVTAYSDEAWTEGKIYQHASSIVTGDYVTQLNGGDTWTENTLSQVEKAFKEKKLHILMLRKVMPEEVPGAFAGIEAPQKILVKNLEAEYNTYPFYFGGTFVAAEVMKQHDFCPELGLEEEREFFLKLCAKEKKLIYLPNTVYRSAESREGDITFYKGIYDTKWYEESFTEFWLPFLENMKETYGQVPEFIQYNLMFSICSRIDSNSDNRNKHVIEEGREHICFELMGKALQYVSDDIMMNMHKIPGCEINDSTKWLFGILKYGADYKMEKYYLGGNAYYGAGRTILNRIANLKTNMVFLNYKDGKLEIDGTIHPIVYSMADEVYFLFNGKKYSLNYNERYTLTKVFGVSVYKQQSFHVTLPMEGVKDCYLYCYARIGGENIRIFFSYNSHFSRLSNVAKNCYWTFGKDTKYLIKNENEGIRFRTVNKTECVKQELRLLKELFFKKQKKAWIFILIRLAYYVTRPILKRRPIWMYLDKIYKGGDSSEYLYRYASKQKNNFRHYYLIDKNATDYKRLKKDGFKPLVRGSILHRLVFLMADMMVISNSTVFAFNNFGMANSAYIRDLVDFHVCCVQHGMSVQKIAIAQNRLRDNTRLYFCASEYEIENLSRPVYDYVGYDALKLTGVPRYDGLVNNDKKQIMISPTWRMQAAVPVRTSEGEQRDYNPMFKESTYYKVFNSLINDQRLIDAAKKYGYKIKYVLHPIVSAQVDDFDKNEYVDIVPAVGDMSYEQMFCESSLMVTDFSGIQFDFAYMRKPLVYLHHKDIPQHYEEGSFFYDTMGFGEICHDNDELIDLLCEYMANGCQMKEEYVRRADDFFYYDDHNNCERIYKEMLEYQEKNIL